MLVVGVINTRFGQEIMEICFATYLHHGGLYVYELQNRIDLKIFFLYIYMYMIVKLPESTGMRDLYF